MELGPVQKAWIASLREHPERQTSDILGKGTPEDYKACCLGELLVVEAKVLGHALPFTEDGIIYDGDSNGEFNDAECLANSYGRLGLKSGAGSLTETVALHLGTDKERRYHCLAGMNDHGVPWNEIADYIESDPENVFTKSV